jgi:hypothetical protein
MSRSTYDSDIQLIVLRRKMSGRPWLTNNDRWFVLQMYRWFPSILKVVRMSPSKEQLAPKAVTPDVAGELIRFVTGPTAVPIIKSKGMELWQ